LRAIVAKFCHFVNNIRNLNNKVQTRPV